MIRHVIGLAGGVTRCSAVAAGVEGQTTLTQMWGPMLLGMAIIVLGAISR